MEHPKLSITDKAKEAITKLLTETESEPLSVVVVWASRDGQGSWWWSIAFHRTAELDPQYRFKVSGMDFYFDGPFYKDDRTLNGKTIDFVGGVFKVG